MQAAPAAPIRVCFIGSSFVGAVYAAYSDRSITKGFEFSFFANAGPGYHKMGFADGAVRNAAFTNKGSANIADYDCFVIYGDMPGPHTWLERDRTLAGGSYSAQMRQAAWRHWLGHNKSLQIMTGLRSLTPKPIFMLSRNISQRASGLGTQADHDEGAALIGRLIAPSIYIPFPPALLTADRQFKAEYHQGSVDIGVGGVDHDKMPRHHLTHLNKAGGALVLAQIVAYLREVQADPAPKPDRKRGKSGSAA